MLPIVMAPIKGYTDPLWRSCYFKHFGGVDKVVTPFLLLSEHNRAKKGYFPKFLPELGSDIEVVPQFLVKRGDTLIDAANHMFDLGVKEFNLNMGCPAPAIRKKGRGSGLLEDPDTTSRLLDKIIPNVPGDFTVKIRTGIEDSSLLPSVIELLNDYPLKEVIIHPRYALQLYNGIPDMDAFDYGYKNSKNPVSYNGDLYSVDDYNLIVEKYPELSSIMIGRGLLRDPFLPSSIKRGSEPTDQERREKLLLFIEDLKKLCDKAYFKEITAFSRMKSFLLYIGEFYSDNPDDKVRIKRAENLDQIFKIISLN